MSALGKSEDLSILGNDARALINKEFYICENKVSKAYCRKDKQICDTSSGTARCVCSDGWRGKNCDEDIDECFERYPCPGVKDVDSFCVDYDPPIRYKCQCMRGYKAVYLDSDSSENDPYYTFHPVDCIKVDSCTDNPCHTDAVCSENSSDIGFTCSCKKGLVGDGITSCSVIPTASPTVLAPFPKQTAYPTTKEASLDHFCTLTNECTVLHSHCVFGKCTCQEGFVRRKFGCINVNECKSGYLNSCHRNAVCIDTLGSYECRCKDGFHDKNTFNPPGTNCVQTNECIVEGQHLCDLETEVCIDRRPPMKWECINKTLAPTKFPSRRFVPPVPRCGRVRSLVDTEVPVTTAPLTPAPLTSAPLTNFPVIPAPVC